MLQICMYGNEDPTSYFNSGQHGNNKVCYNVMIQTMLVAFEITLPQDNFHT